MASDSTTNDSLKISSAPLQEFHLFAELPIEIQLQIWEKAAQVPRMIDIDNLSGDRGPALLRTCRDSRAITRPKYQDFRATRIRDSVKVGFFVNISIDVFRVCQFNDEESHNRWQIVALLNIVSCRYPPWLNNAERLAISLSSETHGSYPNGFLEQSWRQLNMQFPALKELVLIMDSEKDVKLDDLVDIRGGPDKLGRIVERFGTSLKESQEEKGLLMFLKLSFMKGKNVPDPAPGLSEKDKRALWSRRVQFNGSRRVIPPKA